MEFKRDDWKPGVAATQAAAASAIALYNRYQLLLRAVESENIEKPGDTSRVHDLSSIRHYALTFTGPTYTIWLLQPSVALFGESRGVWSGCQMSYLSHGDCTDVSAVARLADWINEIHRWGLTEHARSC